MQQNTSQSHSLKQGTQRVAYETNIGKATRNHPRLALRPGQIPEYLLKHKRDQFIFEETKKQSEFEREVKNKTQINA